MLISAGWCASAAPAESLFYIGQNLFNVAQQARQSFPCLQPFPVINYSLDPRLFPIRILWHSIKVRFSPLRMPLGDSLVPTNFPPTPIRVGLPPDSVCALFGLSLRPETVTAALCVH